MSPQYLAGFIDADGCISVQKRKSRNHNYYSDWVLNIANHDYSLLESVQQAYGGIFRRLKNDCHQLRFRKTEAINLLNDVIPYLHSKQRRAQLLWYALTYNCTGAERRLLFQEIANEVYMKRGNYGTGY